MIGEETWEDDVRTIVNVAQLRDVTVATYPAYPAASIELRNNTSTGGRRRQEGAIMDPQSNGAATAETEVETSTTTATEITTETRTAEPETETRTDPEPTPAGSLRVEQRTSAPSRGLAEEFRQAGFPGESAEIPWEAYEQRAVTWSPSVNLLNQADRVGGAFPVDQRYAWTALQREPVDAGVTSVQVLVHVGQDAATGVVRDIDATTRKAEVTSTIDLQTVPLKGVAAIESGIPNVERLSAAIMERRLRHPGDPVLDRHVAAAVAMQTRRGARIAHAGGRHTSNRIDAVIALAMAVDRVEHQPAPAKLLGWL